MSAFLDTLLAAPLPVIAEIKPHTADGLALVGDRTPAELVRSYEEAGAACLSVVTGRWFGGDPRLLRDVTSRCRLPLLQKDFIVTERHVAHAVELGASAVLLTATLLPAGALATLVSAALRAGLTPFVEVVDEAQIAAVPHPDECVIAVNNKDIADRERGDADLDRSATLLPAVLASGCLCPVSASGIEHPTQAAVLLDAGYRGVLVGTALLRAASPAEWLRGVVPARVSR